MKTKKLLTHEGDLLLMSSPHGEVVTLVQNNREEMCFRSVCVICRAAVELLFSGTFLHREDVSNISTLI